MDANAKSRRSMVDGQISLFGGMFGAPNVLPASQVSSLEQLAVQAAIALRNSEKIRDDLLDISADGIIDNDEQKTLENVLAMLGRIAQVAHQLQTVARRLSVEEA